MKAMLSSHHEDPSVVVEFHAAEVLFQSSPCVCGTRGLIRFAVTLRHRSGTAITQLLLMPHALTALLLLGCMACSALLVTPPLGLRALARLPPAPRAPCARCRLHDFEEEESAVDRFLDAPLIDPLAAPSEPSLNPLVMLGQLARDDYEMAEVVWAGGFLAIMMLVSQQLVRAYCSRCALNHAAAAFAHVVWAADPFAGL